MYLKAVSSGAEVVVDWPGALHLLLCYSSMVAKRSLSYIHFRTFRTDSSVDKTGTFTGEVISELEGLMCSAGMDDLVGK